MPTNTYVALDKITATNTTTVTFTSIPQTYTDLVIVISGNSGPFNDGFLRLQVGNGSVDTNGANYSATRLYGNGTSATCDRYSGSQPAIMFSGSASTGPSNAIISLMNYNNTNVFKTTLITTSATGNYVSANVQLWRSTSAINTLSLISNDGNWSNTTTFSLYGIKSQVTGTAKATGGTITYDAFGNVIHTFTSSGTFTPSQSLSVDYLVVAGGGGGAAVAAGGGGGGGLRSTVTATGGGGSLESALSLTSNTNYTVTVGAGGAVAASSGTRGTSGANSVFSTITATGGGGGGTYTVADGLTGGSGGGGGFSAGTGGSGTTNQGYAGQNFVSGDSSSNFISGGGGGAGATGSGGTGGNGVATSISGSSVTYAGGGGGGVGFDISARSGGSGGGGTGSRRNTSNGTSGTANTGGGGGAADLSNGQSGGSGGSGIVIIRYAG